METLRSDGDFLDVALFNGRESRRRFAIAGGMFSLAELLLLCDVTVLRVSYVSKLRGEDEGTSTSHSMFNGMNEAGFIDMRERGE